MRRGELTLKILEAIKAGAESITEVFEALAPAYTPSQRRQRARIRERIYYKELDRQRLYSLIHKLKKEGLIKTPSPFGWLTEKGESKIEKLKEQISCRRDYQIEKTSELTIVTFDIPEKYREHRNWIRDVLKNLGFNALQKSVFIGYIKIPHEFIQELDKKSMLHHVQIFSIGKSGTLKDYIDGEIKKIYRAY